MLAYSISLYQQMVTSLCTCTQLPLFSLRARGRGEDLLRATADSDSGREARSKIRFSSYLQASTNSVLEDHKHGTQSFGGFTQKASHDSLG